MKSKVLAFVGRGSAVCRLYPKEQVWKVPMQWPREEVVGLEISVETDNGLCREVYSVGGQEPVLLR